MQKAKNKIYNYIWRVSILASHKEVQDVHINARHQYQGGIS